VHLGKAGAYETWAMRKFFALSGDASISGPYRGVTDTSH